MLARRDAAIDAIPASALEPMHTVRWPDNGSLGFESTSTAAHDAYCDTVGDVVLFVPDNSVSGLVEDHAH